MAIFRRGPSTRDLINALREEQAAIRQELVYGRDENLNIARQIDRVSGELAASRDENLNIARQIDRVSGELAASRDENLNIARQIDRVNGELARQIDRVNGELARQFDRVYGELRQELAATRDEHITLAQSLDGLQTDLERLAMAVDDISTDEGHALLEAAHGAMQQALRIAVIGTPRSGNSWLRLMLGRYYYLEECVADLPSEIGAQPARAIVQIHWPPENTFVDILAKNNFKPVVVARHPLDVLISVLHFIRHEPRTAKWLGGKAAIPSELNGKSPLSPEFRDFSLSEGAANLLAVTRQWWSMPGVVRCRYEDLMKDTPGALRRIRNGLRVRGAIPIADAASAIKLDDMRALNNKHGWRASPGHWCKLILPELAAQIYERHRDVFEILNYDLVDYRLTESDALAYWQSIASEAGA